MKNLSFKLLSYIEKQINVTPNSCQVSASKEIEKALNLKLKKNIFKIFNNNLIGIYLHGSVGVGKSILLKALHIVFKKSEIFHFSDLAFYLQSSKKNNIKKLLKEINLIIIDEFYINNLTNIILFKNFLEESLNQKKIIIMSGNKKIDEIYHDPINAMICNEIKDFLNKKFIKIEMKSKIDYRSKNKFNHNFFYIQKENSNKQLNLLRKKYSITSIPREIEFKRAGNNFLLQNYYGNLIDISFNDFFKKKLVFQDYVLILKKIKFLIIRNIPQMNESSKDLLYRFISFIDAIYDNKNILSISTKVELEQLYLGKSNSFEFKRTISRLKEMGSSYYINVNLKKIFK